MEVQGTGLINVILFQGIITNVISVQFSSVTQSCPTL